MRVAVLACMTVTLLATSAAADAISDFGLTGEWAVDCAKPPALDNPHMTFTTSADGQPLRALRMNSAFDGTFDMKDAKLLGTDRLTYVVTDKFGTYTIVIGKTGDQWRSLESTRHSDGQVLIRDGKIVDPGRPTPLFTRCRAG